MCSFILCVICFTLSFGLRSFIRYGIIFLLSYALYCHLHLWCVLSCDGSWVLFYLVQSDRVPHPVCHMFYIVMSTLCFILFHVFYVLLYIVYSDCYLHSMCHYVSSCHVHPGYVILFHVIYFQIVLSILWPVELIQPDGQNVQSEFAQNQMLWYATTPPTKPRNIWQFQLETMTRWTHDEPMKKQVEKSQQPLSRCFNMLLSGFIC